MTRKLTVLAAALVVATALFAAKVLIYPPVTLAASSQSLDIGQLTSSASKDLPSFETGHQRHLNVLDVLNAP
jgi:hypothetical protein